jgi:hypothetical protein
MDPQTAINIINFNRFINGTQFATYFTMTSSNGTRQKKDFHNWSNHLADVIISHKIIHTSSTNEASFTRGPITALLYTPYKWQKEKVVENPPPNTSTAFFPA